MLERLLVAASAALVCAGSQAGDPCPDHPIRFAHYEFGLLHSEGAGGIDDDVQKELERRSGCSFTVSQMPRARIWYELERGGVDMAGSGVQTPERERFAWFAHYVLEDNQVALGSQVPSTVHSMEDFIEHTQLQMGGVRSYSYSPYYDRQVQRLADKNRFQSVNDPVTLYRMLDKERFDLVITSNFLLPYYVKKLQLHRPLRVERWDPAGPTPSGLVLAKGTFTSEQARQWQAYITDMLRDGTLQRILVQHMGETGGARYLYTPPKAKSP